MRTIIGSPTHSLNFELMQCKFNICGDGWFMLRGSHTAHSGDPSTPPHNVYQ